MVPAVLIGSNDGLYLGRERRLIVSNFVAWPVVTDKHE